MMYLAVDSGMRWGELIGLQRKNLDLANRLVRVVDQLVRTVDGTFHRTQPKTSASIRSITISKMTAEVLAVHLESFAGDGRDGLVFPNTAGNPLAESSFYVHHFKKAQEACGLRLRFHDLRHTSVALAIAGGAHPKAIQARMGHSSIAVTLDRYGHVLPSLDADIADEFDRQMQAAKANRERKVIHANFVGDAVAAQAPQRKKHG
jgi:integrase